MTDALGQTTTFGPDNHYITGYFGNDLRFFYYLHTRVEAMNVTMRDSVHRRMAGQDPLVCRDIFSNLGYRGLPGTSFVPNTNFWAPDLRQQLTGVHVLRPAWDQSGALTMVTPRHALTCAHRGPETGETITYVSADGSQIFRTTIISHIRDLHDENNAALWLSSSDTPSITRPGIHDSMICMFADPAPEWLHIMPVLALTNYEMAALKELQPPLVIVSQGNSSPEAFPNNPNSWTPHGRRLCVTNLAGNFVHSDPSDIPFSRDLVVGDSGTPAFALIDDTLYFFKTISDSGGGGAEVCHVYDGASTADYIDTLIARADAAAGVSTGYKLNRQIPYSFNNVLSQPDSDTSRKLRLATDMGDQIMSRIAGRTAANSLPFFTAGTDVFAGTYVPNPDFWAIDIRSQFTGMHHFTYYSRGHGLTAITPRHVINCAHNGPGAGDIVRYVNVDGTVFQTTLQVYLNDAGTSHGAWTGAGKGYGDLSIYLLADPLPEWAYKAPIVDAEWLGMSTIPYAYGGELRFPLLRATQAFPTALGPISRKLEVIGFQGAEHLDIPQEWYAGFTTGDSGTPVFMLIGGQVYLYSVFSGEVCAAFVHYINDMIARADVQAGISTGYSLHPYQNDYLTYWSYEVRSLAPPP